MKTICLAVVILFASVIARAGKYGREVAPPPRLAICLLHQDKENKRSPKSRRLRATFDPNYLRQFLSC